MGRTRTAGVSSGGFDLSVTKASGMDSKELAFPVLSIPPQVILRGISAVSRDEFVSRFVQRRWKRNPGIGVVLRRVGCGVTQDITWMRSMKTSIVRFSAQFELHCATSMLLDATGSVAGLNAAKYLDNALKGPRMRKSLHPLGEIVHGIRPTNANV